MNLHNTKIRHHGYRRYRRVYRQQKDTTDTADTTLIHSGSSVGSLKGNTTIVAGGTYTQTGSTVAAHQGNVDIHAKAVNISAAQNHYANEHKHTFEQKGITVAVNVPVVNAVQGAIGTAQAAGKIGQSKNDRVNAMAAANAAWDGYRSVGALSDIAKDPKAALSQDVSVSITYGQQKNTQQTQVQGHQAQASQVIGGGTVNISATGGGKDSDINIIGADIAGKQGTHLQADNQVNLLAAGQEHSEHSQNKSTGFNAGVAVSYGQSGMAFGFTAGGNYGKGHGNGDETTWRHSQVGDAGSRTTIHSGGATNIKGAQVIGKGVGIDAAELNIESLQNTAQYNSKQQNISGQITVGYGASGSANYSQSKMNADYAAVSQQSGILAGDDGYQINIKGHTDLKGGLITSTAQAEAEGKNRFSTGTLSHSDIANHAEYKGESFGIGGSATVGGSNLGQGSSNSTPGLMTAGQSNSAGKTIGYGSDSGSQSSSTKSGINTQNIIITDEAGQQQRSGKTAAETIVAVKTDITTDNHANTQAT
ncbi:hemagglutinin repeat-containing protein [Paralysiella testudinis]|uniref:Hemagglutinin repeat-containing protein n=1 Tax=Paralysiella testudinis TaxID=2809020 RepID=A0A892ZGQ5_9NEIS|nr:hemagglutinin repeat-containing protein [Paralysiella testudinis]QRQ80926.1 hemagglutinin repeat-containing protein [Paralysiella testudinis]